MSLYCDNEDHPAKCRCHRLSRSALVAYGHELADDRRVIEHHEEETREAA